MLHWTRCIISDFYATPSEIRRNLEALVHRGQDLCLFHIVDPGEINPEFASVTALRDLESGQKMHVDPEYLAESYREKFSEHCEVLSALALRSGAHYVQVNTAEPLDETLRRYLLLRHRKS